MFSGPFSNQSTLEETIIPTSVHTFLFCFWQFTLYNSIYKPFVCFFNFMQRNK